MVRYLYRNTGRRSGGGSGKRIKEREAEGLDASMTPVCTIMVGRLDD